MRNKAIISAIMATFLSAGGSAFADGNDHRDDRGRGSQSDRHDDHGRAQNDRRHDDRGAGPRHDLRKGGRLSNEYRGKQYVVNDWRGHRLSAPPRGYHWVQTGSDYVLVRISTGIIAQIVIH
jgi:Ni/Co efflux regulator RcnB